MTLSTLPENTSVSQSVNGEFTANKFNADAQKERRERRRRTKQWSDGVIGMVHGPLEHELSSLSLRQPRPLRTSSVVELRIPTPEDVKAHVEEEHGEDSWRFRTIQILHNKKVEYFFMALLLLDVLILFVEVSLHALYPPCHIIKRDGISCTPVDHHETNHTRSLAGGSQEHHEEICSASNSTTGGIEWSPQPNYPVGCDPHKWHDIHVAEEVLFVITMIILSLFFVELNVMMVVLTPKVFFRQIFFLADYIIIAASLAMELTFHLANKELTSTLSGLLIVFRSWRYVRISHGIIEVTMKIADRDTARLLNYAEHLENILQERGIALPEEERKKFLHNVENEPELMAKVRRHHVEEKRAKKESETQQETDGEDGADL